MARAKQLDKQRAVNSGISLPTSLIKDARKAAFSQGKSLSGLVRELLLKELKA